MLEITQEINNHNEWALKEIDPHERMLCGCGRIVAINWMETECKNEVGLRCALCFRKDNL